jgi:nicotinate-nucleotide adenylyltransferase
VALNAVKPRRIGVFGGAFDPPHLAHVALAKAALTTLDLTSLHIVPTGNAWHKTRVLSAAIHRLAMVKFAFDEIADVVVDEIELNRTGPSFTIDTLKTLQAANPDAQLCLIIGADQCAAFTHWHDWEEILRIAIICVADRAISAASQAQLDVFTASLNASQSISRQGFLSLSMPPMAQTATQIRELVAASAGEIPDLSDWVPGAVARYISQHHLYTAG